VQENFLLTPCSEQDSAGGTPSAEGLPVPVAAENSSVAEWAGTARYSGFPSAGSYQMIVGVVVLQ